MLGLPFSKQVLELGIDLLGEHDLENHKLITPLSFGSIEYAFTCESQTFVRVGVMGNLQ